MATQPLTKGRLMQILVVLAVLTIAFFWRTFSYNQDSVFNITCTQGETCRVNVNSLKLIVQPDGQDMTLLNVKPDWIVTSQTSGLSQDSVKVTFPLSTKSIEIDTQASKIHINFVP